MEGRVIGNGKIKNVPQAPLPGLQRAGAGAGVGAGAGARAGAGAEVGIAISPRVDDAVGPLPRPVLVVVQVAAQVAATTDAVGDEESQDITKNTAGSVDTAGKSIEGGRRKKEKETVSKNVKKRIENFTSQGQIHRRMMMTRTFVGVSYPEKK